MSPRAKNVLRALARCQRRLQRFARVSSGRGIARAIGLMMIELAFTIAASTLFGSLCASGNPGRGLAALASGLFASLLGLWLRVRSGALKLALDCPRLASRGLRLSSRRAPWPTLRAAERALRALDEEGRASRDFFSGAGSDLLLASLRALELHALAIRQGPRSIDARRELIALTSALRALRRRILEAVLAPRSAIDPLPALHALATRADALADAKAREAIPIQTPVCMELRS